MSVLHPYAVTCVCGTSFQALLAESVNVGRMPKARAEILAGTFHRFTCPGCQKDLTIEKEFVYTDLATNTFIKVKPPNKKHQWRETSVALIEDVSHVPPELMTDSEPNMRVVFGLGELREKLLAQEAGLDDRLVELLKVLLINEHPVLLARPRLRFQLDEASEQNVGFVATYEHDRKTFRLEIPPWLLEGIKTRRNDLERWLAKNHGKASIFDLVDDHWISLWRWSPQPSALSALKRYAEQVRAGHRIKTTTPEFQLVLRHLPRGTHLPGWAKKDLHELFLYAKKWKQHKLQEQLFELRFGIGLEDDWALNDDPEDIATLWKLLRDLPESNVEGNAFIREIYLSEGEGGGFYNPWSHDIHIGERELALSEHFEDTIRHEVGHAVHEQLLGLVDPWLEARFGWHMYSTKSDEIDDWVDLMGGWGDLNRTEQSQVRDLLRSALGKDPSWNPGPTPNPPADHPWWRADFGPRLAHESSGGTWYKNNRKWYRHNGKAFALNYWYKTFMVIDTQTLDFINESMPSQYAAMSHMEFFAELYALYYDLDDPMRGNVPADVVQWLEDNVGPADAAEVRARAVLPPRPEELPEWHWITRPD